VEVVSNAASAVAAVAAAMAADNFKQYQCLSYGACDDDFFSFLNKLALHSLE
jgi:hypothetical protein